MTTDSAFGTLFSPSHFWARSLEPVVLIATSLCSNWELEWPRRSWKNVDAIVESERAAQRQTCLSVIFDLIGIAVFQYFNVQNQPKLWLQFCSHEDVRFKAEQARVYKPFRWVLLEAQIGSPTRVVAHPESASSRANPWFISARMTTRVHPAARNKKSRSPRVLELQSIPHSDGIGER